MRRRIAEGDKFKSPFTGSVFRVKKIYQDRVHFEEIVNENHQLISEAGAVVSLYEKVDERGL